MHSIFLESTRLRSGVLRAGPAPASSVLNKQNFSHFLRWRPGRLAHNTAHAGIWNLIRIVVQALSLVLLARVLGADGYGALAGSVALCMIFGQFSGLGSGIALVRHVARGGELRGRLVATERAYLLSGLPLFALVWPLSISLLGESVSVGTLACLGAAEVLIAPALQPLVYRYQAEERMFLSSAIGTLAPAARLVAAASVALFGLHDVETFALLYLVWIFFAVGTALYLAWPRGGDTAIGISTAGAIREGLPYAVSGVALTAGSELDKTVLLRLAGTTVTGPYAAAYRIAMAATLPVNALVLAASPRLFRAPSSQRRRLVGVMLASVLGYALVAVALLWVLAPFVPWLLGNSFVGAEPLLRALCVVVITGSLRLFVTALLTTSDLQNSRNVIEISGVCISLVLLILLVPRFSAYGAIAALAISDLCTVSLGVVRIMHVRSRPSSHVNRTMRSLLRRMVEYTGTGSWIYAKEVLSWTTDKAIVSQLPGGLRLFSLYAKLYNKYIGTRTIVLAHGVYRLLRLVDRESVVRVVIKGRAIWLNLDDPGALNAIHELYHGSDVSEELELLCRTSDLFVDIGANQGALTAIATSSLPNGARIIAIEPQLGLAECIERTLSEARPQGGWKVCRVAVGHQSSMARMVIPPENFGEAHLTSSGDVMAPSLNTISITTLDALLDRVSSESRVVVKMDIEGYEISALQGGYEFFVRCRPAIILEINPTAMARYGHSVNELSKWLSKLGYRYWKLCGKPQEYQPLDRLPEHYCDVVLCAAKPAQ